MKWDPQAGQQRKSIEVFASAQLRNGAYLGEMKESSPLMAKLDDTQVLVDGSGGACESPSTAG